MQSALSLAVELNIITQAGFKTSSFGCQTCLFSCFQDLSSLKDGRLEAQINRCNERLDDFVKKGMDAEGLWCTREILDQVRESVMTSPSQIMGIFAEMGVFQVTSVWADFMDEK